MHMRVTGQSAWQLIMPGCVQKGISWSLHLTSKCFSPTVHTFWPLLKLLQNALDIVIDRLAVLDSLALVGWLAEVGWPTVAGWLAEADWLAVVGWLEVVVGWLALVGGWQWLVD